MKPKSLLIVIGLGFVVLTTLVFYGLDNSEELNQPETVEALTTVVPALVYKEEVWEMKFPNGEIAQEKTVQVPYVTYGEEEVKVFEEIAGLRIDHDQTSDSGDFIYFSVGNGKDAGVRPYIFDVQNRLLHRVCITTSDENCESHGGFAAHDYLNINWGKGNLYVSYAFNGEVVEYENVSKSEPWQWFITREYTNE